MDRLHVHTHFFDDKLEFYVIIFEHNETLIIKLAIIMIILKATLRYLDSCPTKNQSNNTEIFEYTFQMSYP